MTIDIGKFELEFFDMPDNHVQELMLALHLHHQLPVVTTFLTWDDLMSSASIPDEYRNHAFTDEDKREICYKTEEATERYIIPEIVKEFINEIETFLLRRQTEDRHFGEKANND